VGQISLKKILHKKDVVPVIYGIINSIGSPVTIEDAGGAALLTANEGSDNTGRYPIEVSGEIIGWVTGGGKIAPVASMLSYMAEKELERKTLANETLNKYKELTLLYELSESVAACLDMPHVSGLIIEQIKLRQFVNADNISIMLMNDETRQLEIIAAYGSEFHPKTFLKSGEGIAGSVFANGKAEIVNDVAFDERFVRGANKVSSLICAPLRVKDKCIGVINVSSAETYEYRAEDLKFLNVIADQAAASIENARLYDELKETFFMAVSTLAETIEKRDPYTGGHTKRVMEYSLAIGRALALTGEDMTRLKLSAILHDVGKIGVSDSVLLKPGRLTDEEFEEIKKHTVYGAEILNHIKQFKHIIPGVKQHHEKYDGKGYPDGLKGDEIDITARIIAVADSFDAMTSNRPYRQGLSLDTAFEELRKHAGAQFDPDIVSAFFTADIMEAFFEGNSRGKVFI
jgi:putative nucleotidyltransferase with HDIG domain